MANIQDEKIEKLIEELKLQDEITLEGVKEIILNEKDGSIEFNYLVSVFVSKIRDINRANEVTQVVSDAWNTFPHKSLGGLSPQEVTKSSNES